jgi:uncharacterized metal-binding protein YceD (DUF177 family)
MTEPARITPEFSRPVAAESVGAQPVEHRIEASPAEREALAGRFGLLALERLEATLVLRRDKGDVLRLEGHFLADVQSCVVTLAPVPAHLEAGFETSYSASAVAAEEDLDPLGDDAPEPIPGGEVDLGEAVAQQLAVTLDPYPRVPGAALAPMPAAMAENPFDALSVLKKKR